MLERDLTVLAYAESKVRGQRVAIVGPNTAALGERVLGLGARSVHVFDDHAPRRHERGLVIEGLSGDEFPVRPGAFDVVFAPRFDGLADAPRWLVRFRRMVTESGLVFVGAAANSGILSYDHLYDLVSVQFEHIRMVGELPFHGVAMAELGERDEAVDVGIDTQLAEEENSPFRYWAVGSASEFELDPYTVIQLGRDEGDLAPPTPPRDTSSRIRALESELSRARAEGARAAEAPAHATEEIERLRHELDVRETRLAEFATQMQRLTGEAERATEALKDKDRAYRDLEVKHEQQLRGLETDELKRVRECALLQTLLAEARSELKRRDEALDSLTKEVEAKFEAQLEEEASADAEAHEREGKLAAEITAMAASHAEEVDSYEQKLRELSMARKAAEDAHVLATRIAEDLVRKLGGPPSHGSMQSASNADLEQKLEHLADLVARLTGEVEARGWRITELEEALSLGANAAQAAPPARAEVRSSS